MNGLAQDIIRTIRFFDIFNYPLTPLETHRLYLRGESSPSLIKEGDRGVDFTTVLTTLSQLVTEKKLSTLHGFYFLPGREELVEKRRSCQIMAIPRWDIALRAFRWLRSVPFIKMAALCNMNPIDAVRPESDIDVFIITAPRRLWLARAFTTTLFALTGVWRSQSAPSMRVKDKLCLSFFVSQGAQDLAPLQRQPYDPYLLEWVALLAPMYEGGAGAMDSFWQANSWIKKYLPNAEPMILAKRRLVKTGKNWWGKLAELVLGGWVGDQLEHLAHFLQFRYMLLRGHGPRETETSSVIVTKDVLKFHEVDRRVEFAKRLASE